MTATGGSSSLTTSATDVYAAAAAGLPISSSGSLTPTATALRPSPSPAHKRRDKVFEYLMNYGVKHRQRREDDDDEKAALLNNGGAGVGSREAQLVVGRKRKHSYAVTRG